MPKSELEKQLEKQGRQAKQLADRQRRDNQKQAREAERTAHKEAIRVQAASIVNGQPLVDNFRVMDPTSEEVLRCLLQCELHQGNHIRFNDEDFPGYVQMSIPLEIEKLIQYGMVAGPNRWMGGGTLYIQPPAFTYFQDKQEAMERQKNVQATNQISNVVNYGNLVVGNVSDSTMAIDNSIQHIEKAIDDQGGEDKEELHALLEEVKELIDNMKTSRSIPRQKRLYERLQEHLCKHGWFYGAVIQLLGTAAMGILGA